MSFEIKKKKRKKWLLTWVSITEGMLTVPRKIGNSPPARAHNSSSSMWKSKVMPQLVSNYNIRESICRQTPLPRTPPTKLVGVLSTSHLEPRFRFKKKKKKKKKIYPNPGDANCSPTTKTTSMHKRSQGTSKLRLGARPAGEGVQCLSPTQSLFQPVPPPLFQPAPVLS